MDFRVCQQHWWGCKQLWWTRIICMFTCYSCISKCLLLVIHSLSHYLKMVGCILSVWSAINVCGFCSRHRLMEKEREAGVLLLFEEERGLGEGTEHAWESSSVALWTEDYCPGNLSEWLPWGPLPLALPHPLSLSLSLSYFFPSFTLLSGSLQYAFCSSQLKLFTFSSNYLTNSFSCHSDSHSRLFVCSVSLAPLPAQS